MSATILRRMAAGLVLALVCGGAVGAQAQTASVVEDVYLENGVGKVDTKLKVQSGDRVRVTYLKVTVANAGTVKSAKLRLRCDGDGGSGVMRVYKGSHSNWTTTSLTAANAPAALTPQITQKDIAYVIGQDYDFDLSALITKDGTYTIIIKKDELGGDVAFSSTRGEVAPKLLIEVGTAVNTTVPQINQFRVVPEAGASAALIDYTVTASIGTTLSEIQVHRAPDVSGNPGTWKYLVNNSMDVGSLNKTTYTGSTRDGISDTGYYWYKIVVVDKAGKSTEAAPIKVRPADEPGTIPDDPVVPPATTTVPQIHAFTVVPEAGASAAIINYSVSASDGAKLQEIQVWRAPDASGIPGEWKHLLGNSADVSALNISSYIGGTRDGVADTGFFWYKIVVVDKAGKTAAADPIKVRPSDEPGGTTPPATGPVCGANGCEVSLGETCATCPKDCGICPVNNISQAPANPNATSAARNVLKYLYSLKSRKDNKVIAGQFYSYQMGEDRDQYDEYITAIYEQTGQYPGLIGVDPMAGPPTGTDPSNWANARLIDSWKKGSLITMNWHMVNPVNLSTARDRDINFSNIYKEGTVENIAWKKQLDMTAEVLAELRDAGVVVLWRPMHEMVAWWWWGRRPDFAKAWQYMFNYFTYTKKLNNLLWVYSSSYKPDLGPVSMLTYYPGDEYVDVVGMSIYSENIWDVYVPYYDALRSTGKPFVMGELGLGTEPDRPPVDYYRIIKRIKEAFPETAYFYCWGTQYAIGNNTNIYELMNDPWIANRGEINF